MTYKIIPALLHDNYADFTKKLKQVESFAEYVQIDVMDGIFVSTKSFSEINEINKLKSPAKFELHLMVEHPLDELKKWDKVQNIFRIIFHVESADDPHEVIKQIREKNWQVGIALNPDTPLEAIEPYTSLVDLVLFLTVNPGRQGAPFIPEVLEKIVKFSDNIVKRATKPLIAVDGAVNMNNIVILKNAGVEIFNIGSALTMASNPEEAYNEFKSILSF